ncbi:MAG: leucine-rich repeat domain-containing protein [Clostridiales bacterium]|nr:leucine-rich repeat domain-containing protein [Clostridiales bacterium]
MKRRIVTRIFSLLLAVLCLLAPVGSAMAASYEWGTASGEDGKRYARINGYHGTETVIVVPLELGGLPVHGFAKGGVFNEVKNTLTAVYCHSGVTNLPANMFDGYPALQTVSLSEGATYIGNYAFRGCISMTEPNLPSTITEVGTGAFANCTGISSFHMQNIVSISTSLFDGCTNLTSLTLTSAQKGISAYALRGTPLTSLTFPEGLETVHGNAFTGSNLSYIWLPDSVTTVKADAFEGTGSTLTTIRWPAGTPHVRGWLFKDCASLKNVILPEGVLGISTAYESDSKAFMGCTGLETMDFPDSLEAIGSSSFEDCTSLRSVTFGSKLQRIGSRAFANTALTTVYLPSGVTSINKNSFPTGCAIICPDNSNTAAALKTAGLALTAPSVLDLPADVVTIEACAFLGTDAEMVIIPEGCVSIGSRAFADMPNLRYVQVPAGTSVAADAFEGCSLVEYIEY